MHALQISVTLVLLYITIVTGYAYFRDSIPNGKNVPHPCRPNYLWNGVGHENPLGGGVRNPFGRDFEANGKVWNECLCQTDSDGDGETNGEELGDPYCDWTPGDVPYTKIGLSHPGVCEPLVSELCTDRNDWEIDCSSPEFVCEDLDETEDVRNVTIQLTLTPVPPKETTYMCQGMDLPSDEAFHMIASEPLIDNENILHHIGVFICPTDDIGEAREKYSEPVECDMAPTPCMQLFTLWGVGVSGACLSSEYGLPMGLKGAQYVILQMHWNNPELKDNYEDASGMVLHYTPNLRTYSAAMLTVGPAYLELPPGYSEIVDEGFCPGECTEYMFTEDIFIAAIIPHMHYLGRKMIVEHWRDGERYATLVNDQDYSYDNPLVYEFDPAVNFRPGDAFNVSCTFETRGEESFTFFGEATSDEMCAANIVYYPIQVNATYCSTFDSIIYCGGKSVTTSEIADQCLEEFGMFLYFHFFDVYTMLQSKCDPTGMTCWEGCEELIDELRNNHTCLHEEADEYIKNAALFSDGLPDEFVYLWISCDEWNGERDPPSDYDNNDVASYLCEPYLNSVGPINISAVMLLMSLAIHSLF